MRVFDQDTYWVDVEGRPHLLATMSIEYVANVASDLVADAQRLHEHAVLGDLVDILVAIESGTFAGCELTYDLGVATAADLSPHEWLESTVLMRALRCRLSE